MAYVIKRTYGTLGQNHDYLQAWCEEWGTVCVLSIKKALVFATKAEADAAADKAQRECKGDRAQWFTFSAVTV